MSYTIISSPVSRKSDCNSCSFPGLLMMGNPHNISILCHLWDFSVKHFLTSSRACLKQKKTHRIKVFHIEFSVVNSK